MPRGGGRETGEAGDRFMVWLGFPVTPLKCHSECAESTTFPVGQGCAYHGLLGTQIPRPVALIRVVTHVGHLFLRPAIFSLHLRLWFFFPWGEVGGGEEVWATLGGTQGLHLAQGSLLRTLIGCWG